MTARASASPSATESASSSACSWEQGCRPVRPPSRRARGASPRSSVGSSSRSDLRRQEMRAGGLEILRRPLLSVREPARLPAARRCVCGPAACCRGAARARRGAVRARPLWRQIFGAPASPVVGGRAAARRAPLCVSRPRAAAAAAAGQRGASGGLFWKRAPRPKLPRRCRRRARRAVRCGPGRPRGSDFSAVNVLCASVLPQELKHTMPRLSNFGARRYVAATST